jgi:hypothetical protein
MNLVEIARSFGAGVNVLNTPAESSGGAESKGSAPKMRYYYRKPFFCLSRFPDGSAEVSFSCEVDRSYVTGEGLGGVLALERERIQGIVDTLPQNQGCQYAVDVGFFRVSRRGSENELRDELTAVREACGSMLVQSEYYCLPAAPGEIER